MQDISRTYLEGVAGLKPRRYGLKEGKIFLYGAPGVGKSALALLYAARHKKVLYINCADCRIDIESANAFILKSYLERHLELLIVDNYTPALSLPNLKSIILIAPSITHCPEDFQPKFISALSFEEYVSFDNKNLSINNLFNLFLKEGNLPQIAFLPPSHKIPRKQEILKLALWNDFEIFTALLRMQGRELTPNYVYTMLKKTHKISKDRIYPLLQSLQERGIIYLVPHTHTKSKKLYFYDFSLPLCVQNDKNLLAVLENMLLLELFNFCLRDKKSPEVSYGDMGEFICALGVFVFIPFSTQEGIESKLKKLHYAHIFVITLNFEGQGCIKTPHTLIHWRAMEFMNFALEWAADF